MIYDTCKQTVQVTHGGENRVLRMAPSDLPEWSETEIGELGPTDKKNIWCETLVKDVWKECFVIGCFATAIFRDCDNPDIYVVTSVAYDQIHLKEIDNEV
jgi:hypothetical protein